MDIQKENTKYLASLLANCGATQDEINDLSFDDEAGFFESNRLADWFVSQINFGWRVWQASKASVPEGFVLVPRIITDEWMEVYVDQVITKYCVDYEDTPHYVRENELPELREDQRLPIRRAHERLMQVIEAQEPSNDS